MDCFVLKSYPEIIGNAFEKNIVSGEDFPLPSGHQTWGAGKSIYFNDFPSYKPPFIGDFHCFSRSFLYSSIVTHSFMISHSYKHIKTSSHDLSHSCPKQGGFLKWGYPQFSSIYKWIFHEINQPFFGIPYLWKPLLYMGILSNNPWSIILYNFV